MKQTPSKPVKIRAVGSERRLLKGTRSSGVSSHQIFFLSPANVTSVRGSLVLGDTGVCALGHRLRSEGASLGEIFTFISGLYFRGKLAYSLAYADPPAGLSGVVVITPAGGLVSPHRVLGLEDFREIVTGRVDASEVRYHLPLERDARLIRDRMGSNCRIVLLGSVATPKYMEPLLGVFGKKLMVPAQFVGRGDMFRGGLMLRCVREQMQLTYVSATEIPLSTSEPARPH